MTTTLETIAEAVSAELDRQIAPQVADFQAGKWGAVFAHYKPPSLLFGGCEINAEVDLRELVRAVLLAVRSPSEEMVEAGGLCRYRLKHSDEDPGFGTQSDDALVFAAMIDAVLSDSPKT